MRLVLAAAALAVVGGIGGAAILAPKAEAVPGQCGGGYGMGSGGEFCDSQPWPDGSFLHYERVCVLGFCGANTFRACDDGNGGRFPTDNDPATPC